MSGFDQTRTPGNAKEMLGDALGFLLDLWRDDVPPDEARERFRVFGDRHRDLSMDLVWEEERYTGATHYDLLLHLPLPGTISLSFCPDRAVPWPLRHAHNPDANVVLRVNDTILTVELVMAYLDFMWDEARVIMHLLDTCLMREEITKRGVEVSDEELQQAMDAFRRKHGLYTADATYQWLEERGTSHERLEEILAGEVAEARLADEITAGRIEDYFNRHAGDFDAAHIARFKVVEPEVAQDIYRQIRGGELDFFEAAARRFCEARPQADGQLFAVVRRGQLSTEQADVIFAASGGEVTPPLRSSDGYELVRVLRVESARLDPPTRETIKDKLFEAWLAARRREASVEWFWGHSQHNPGQPV